MSGHSVLVEFLGLAGVGKSTLSHRVAQVLRDNGLPVEETLVFARGPRYRRIVRKSLKVAIEVFLHPRCAYDSTMAIHSTKQKSISDLVRVLFNWLLVVALVRKRRRAAGIHLLDQGIFQALWSIGFSGQENAIEKVFHKVRRRMPAPSIVVIVEADTSTVARRLKGRAQFGARIEHQHANDRQQIARSASLLEETKRVLQSLGVGRQGVRSLVLQNDDDDIDHKARELATMLEGMLAARVHGKGGRKGILSPS